MIKTVLSITTNSEIANSLVCPESKFVIYFSILLLLLLTISYFIIKLSIYILNMWKVETIHVPQIWFDKHGMIKLVNHKFLRKKGK
jgi:hypothetical protein